MKIIVHLFAIALVAILFLGAFDVDAASPALDLSAIPDVRILRGDGNTAFRDPAVFFEGGLFHLFFSWCHAYPGNCTIGHATSRDLVHWTAPREILCRDCRLNYSSPGNMVKVGDEYVLCMQTYPTQFAKPGAVAFADGTARIFLTRTRDFEHWSEPELIRVKGPDVPEEKMGRMIDAYLIQDHDGLWHCSYKQNGVSFSVSKDLKTWEYVGRIDGGENACVIEDDAGGWVMFHSPANGIGVKRSKDLVHWEDDGLLTFGQKDWPWARGRLTAGTVVDCRKIGGIGKYLMFFHATGPRSERNGDNWRNGSICIAWSSDLKNWSWPGKSQKKSP